MTNKTGIIEKYKLYLYGTQIQVGYAYRTIYSNRKGMLHSLDMYDFLGNQLITGEYSLAPTDEPDRLVVVNRRVH